MNRLLVSASQALARFANRATSMAWNSWVEMREQQLFLRRCVPFPPRPPCVLSPSRSVFPPRDQARKPGVESRFDAWVERLDELPR